MSAFDDTSICRRTTTFGLVVERRLLHNVAERRQQDTIMQIRSPLDLGLAIRQQRRRLGLNQADLAKRVGVGRQWIVAMEQGKTGAELGLVLRTLAALDLALAVNGGGDTSTRKSSPIVPIDINAVVDAAKGRRP
jgi:HTH-type transcriptional regulator/antitoxin HipB